MQTAVEGSLAPYLGSDQFEGVRGHEGGSARQLHHVTVHQVQLGVNQVGTGPRQDEARHQDPRGGGVS